MSNERIAELEAERDGLLEMVAAYDGIQDLRRIEAARTRRLEGVIADLLELPVAKEALSHLDRGVGTKSAMAAWLRARSELK